MKILLVEDNQSIREELATLLSRYQYDVVALEEFGHVVQDILAEEPHLVLLDINLPVYDGYYICRELRKASSVPVIVVTSRDSDLDELMSMNLGADDFITKPYNVQILLARIQSLLNRTYQKDDNAEISHGGLQVSLAKSLVIYDGQACDLTKNELKILHTLLKNSPRIVSRDELMNDLWQSDEFVDDNTLTVNINRLRKKLEGIGAKDMIQTKRGQGYCI